MKNKIIKVDRIKTINEAIELQNAGVDLLSISLSKNQWFNDERFVTNKIAQSIKKELTKSKLVIEVGNTYDSINIIDEIKDIGADYIQISKHNLPTIDFLTNAKKSNINIIYAGVTASYEDDPNWLLSGYLDLIDINISYFQIDLLGDIENSWDFFSKESPNFSEELQIEDIDSISQKHPILVTIDFKPDTVIEIIDKMNNIKGIYMTLGESSMKDDFHYFSYQSILDIVNKFNQKKHNVML